MNNISRFVLALLVTQLKRKKTTMKQTNAFNKRKIIK